MLDSSAGGNHTFCRMLDSSTEGNHTFRRTLDSSAGAITSFAGRSIRALSCRRSVRSHPFGLLITFNVKLLRTGVRRVVLSRF
jgi:hypothetical protein